MEKSLNYLLATICMVAPILLFVGCSKDEDPNVELQARLDSQIEEIENYLSSNNISTDVINGYYLEQITENPDGKAPAEDNILAVYYEIQTLNGDPIAEISAAAGDWPEFVPFNDQRIVLPLSLYDMLGDMRKGEEVRVFLPFNRAYNNYELPGIIPAYSAVIMSIKLDDILSLPELKQLQDARIKAYLADNNLLPADSLAGSVYYYQVETGQSPEVKPESNLEVRYTGRMLDGYVFDSNTDSATPLPVNISNGNFVSGFETALLAMSEGEKGIAVFPGDQGYGANFYAMPEPVSNDLQARRVSIRNVPFFGAYKPIHFDLEVEAIN